MNPGLASLWEEEINRRRVKNMNLDNLSPPASQIRLNVVPTSSHLYYLNIMKQKFKENAVTNVTINSNFKFLQIFIVCIILIFIPAGESFAIYF